MTLCRDISSVSVTPSLDDTTTTASSSTDTNDMIEALRSNVIGDRCKIKTPFGEKEIVYSDYTASGRSLQFVEDYMLDVVIPTYANTHTEASATGAQTTHLREEARDIIHDALNAPRDEYVVLFTGTGATGAIDKLFRVLGLGISEFSEKKWNLAKHIPEKERPIVFISHYEHHSNELMWRESVVRCIVIDEGNDGTPNLDHLERELVKYKDERVPMIGSFSAGSNVTGLRSPVRAIARLLHQYGAYAFFDYAGVGAYVNIDMKGSVDGNSDDSIDAAFFSPHKFIGGPGSSGVLVAKNKLFHKAFDIETTNPTTPGGGTIEFVWGGGQVYSSDIEYREDSGTPGILQSIRAGLAFKVKEMVGSDNIEKLEHRHTAFALSNWKENQNIALMGSDRLCFHLPARRVSIFSFNVLSPVPFNFFEDDSKKFAVSHIVKSLNQYAKIGHSESKVSDKIPLHFNFVITLLNDVYGIQGRSGCSCAGPYSERLFNGRSLDRTAAEQYFKSVSAYPPFKYGWARVNLNYFITDDEAWFIVEAVKQIAQHGWKLLPFYTQDLESGQFIHHSALSSDGSVNKPAQMASIHDLNPLSSRQRREVNIKPKTVVISVKNPKTMKESKSLSKNKTMKESKSLSKNFSQTTILQNSAMTDQRDLFTFQEILDDAINLYKKSEKMWKPEVKDFVKPFQDESHLDNVWWLLPSQVEAYLNSC